MKAAPKHAQTSDYPCACGKGYLVQRKSASGPFWGCTAYPECRNSLPDDKGKPGKRAPAAVAAAGYVCPKCGEPLRQLTAKQGKNAGGKFWGCTGFANGCKFSADDKDGKPVFKEVKNAA